MTAHTPTQAMMYKIIRFYKRGRCRTINTGLTLEQAQAHCNDPETSSSTCTNSAGKARTRRNGPWFDTYDECRRCSPRHARRAEDARKVAAHDELVAALEFIAAGNERPGHPHAITKARMAEIARAALAKAAP